MSIDVDEMVKMAEERKGWQYVWNGEEWGVWEQSAKPTQSYKGWIGDLNINDKSAEFYKQAPAAILALSERIAALEAQNATLQAAGGWRGIETLPRLNERVLCFTSSGTYEVMRRIEQWWVWIDDIGRTRPASYVTHWQALPEPPVYIEP